MGALDECVSDLDFGVHRVRLALAAIKIALQAPRSV
jgi:hypothetical protein